MVQIEGVDEVVITFAFMVAQGKTQTLHHLTFNTFISTCSSSGVHFFTAIGGNPMCNFRHVLSIGVGLLAVDTFDLMERCPIPLITICRPAKSPAHRLRHQHRHHPWCHKHSGASSPSQSSSRFLLLQRILWIGGCWGVRAVGAGSSNTSNVHQHTLLSLSATCTITIKTQTTIVAKQDATRISIRCSITNLFQPNLPANISIFHFEFSIQPDIINSDILDRYDSPDNFERMVLRI